MLLITALRAPKLAIAAFLLALVALAGSLTYTGYLVIGVVSTHLGISRFMAGLLLVVLFARVPWVSQRKMRTVGLLPKNARLPVMVSLLALCAVSFFYRGQIVPLLFVIFAAIFLLAYRRMRKALLHRVLSILSRSPPDSARPYGGDQTIIDVEVREKKD